MPMLILSICSKLFSSSQFPQTPMARPPCPRRIRHRPPADYFKPAGIPIRDLREIELAADELEAVRLRDVEDLYHREAAEKMGVSRQTFDRIVRRAHVKIAAALVSGQALRIARPVKKRLRRG